MKLLRSFALPVVLALSVSAFGGLLSDLTVREEGRSMRTGSAHKGPDGRPDPENNTDRIPRIEPGETAVLADLRGPGVITHFWITFLEGPHRWAPDGAATPQEMVLRIYWDGREKPDVETPIGDFFAGGFGRRMEVKSLPVVVEDGDSYNCFWRMPFRKSARIELVNQGKEPAMLIHYNIDWIKKDSMPEETLYFCARYHQQYPTGGGKEYVVLDARGRGQYVGTFLSVRTRSPSWFGEGDLRVYLDGEEKPSIWGTGTEDYFLSAWTLKENNSLYFGVPYLNQSTWKIVGQKTCAYRWHLHDPILFDTGIRVALETKGWIPEDENKWHRSTGWNEREDDYSSVAFWYQDGPVHPFSPPTTAEERRLPRIDRVIVWGKDAREGGRRGPGRASVQTGTEYRESGGQLLYVPKTIENGTLEFTFEVKEKEPLRLILELTRSWDFGIWQPYLNDVKLGKPLDLYRAETDLFEYNIMDFWPDPGSYTLRLQCVGRNEDSKGEGIGINSIRLRERRPRVKAFGYDRDLDWKTEQRLY